VKLERENRTMNRPSDFPPYAAINAKLTEVVENAPSRPSWYAPWSRLDGGSSDEERLKVYQAVRDSGALPEEAGFYLVAWQADAITSARAGTELREMEERLDELEDQGSLEEYDRLLERYHAAWDMLFVRTLEEHGEREIATLFRNDRDRYEQIHEAGRLHFHGHLPPVWLEEFIVTVGECLRAFSSRGRMDDHDISIHDQIINQS
jgi:hypothetical protein